MKKHLSLSVSAVALMIASAIPTAAWAQSTPASAASEDDTTITVTARRTEERLQDVPVSVTALGANELAAAHVDSLTDVQQLAPSLNITPLNGVGTAATVSIRGQVQTTAGIGVDPSTGVYINELYLARPAGLNAAIFDVQSVQLLRGPQGTLFGRNSVGGALLIETRRPGPDFGGYVDVSVQDPWGYSVEGAINIPVTQGVGVRLAGLRDYVRGYSRVIQGNNRLDDTDQWSGRATVDANLGDFRTTFIADIFRSRVNGPAGFPLPPNPAIVTTANPIRAAYLAEYALTGTRDYRLASQSTPTSGVADTGGVMNISTVDLTESVRLKNVIGMRWQRGDDFVDQDALAADILYTQVVSDTQQFSEEFQVQASLGDALDLIFGAYYFNESGTDRSNSYSLRPTTSIARGQNRFEARNQAVALFTHANWTVPIGVPAHIFGGLRGTLDTREIFFESRNVNADGSFTCTVIGGGTACRSRAERDFPARTWDVGFDIRPIPEILVYGTVARGYRTGGFNGRATNLTQQLPFLPEFVTSYEAGIKTDWTFGNVRGSFNLSAFHADYSDVQRTTVIIGPSGPQSAVANAASATVEGLEAELTMRVGRDVRLRAFYSYIDPQYQVYVDNGIDRSQNEFPFVPRNQAGATVDWTIARGASGDEFGINASWSYRDGFFLEIINSPTTRVDSYHLFNAAVRWHNIRGSGISAELYAENLFDTEYDRGGFSVYTSVGVAQTYRGPPRVIGLSLRVPFGGER